MKYPGHLLKRYPTISHYFCSAAARVKCVLIGCFVQVAALDKSRLLTKRDSRIAATAKSWAIASRKAIAPSSLHCALHCIRMMWPTMPTCPCVLGWSEDVWECVPFLYRTHYFFAKYDFSCQLEDLDFKRSGCLLSRTLPLVKYIHHVPSRKHGARTGRSRQLFTFHGNEMNQAKTCILLRQLF